LAAIGENLAPRVDNQRVAVAFAAAGVLAPLRWCQDESAVLDRPRPQQNMPMSSPGRHREDTRDTEEIGAGLRQRPVQMREADVVADAHPEPAPWRLGDGGLTAGAVGVAFAIAFAAWQVDI